MQCPDCGARGATAQVELRDPRSGRVVPQGTGVATFAGVAAAMDILDRQRIGTLTPTAPVLITSGINDDTVPYPQARQLANEWCGKGASVTFRTNGLPPILPGMALPNHFGPEIIDGFSPSGVIPYLMDRLNDKPVAGCTVD